MAAVRVEPTEAFATAQLAARAGRRQRDLGERAALEVIRHHPLAKDERALLLSDERDIGRVIVIDPDKHRDKILFRTFWRSRLTPLCCAR